MPKGTKEVGSAAKLGITKELCTIMVTMVLEEIHLLIPAIIFNGNSLFYITFLLFILNYFKVYLEEVL